jgi:hypothetical protein
MYSFQPYQQDVGWYNGNEFVLFSCAPISHTDVYYDFFLALLSLAVRKNARAYINVRHAEESGIKQWGSWVVKCNKRRAEWDATLASQTQKCMHPRQINLMCTSLRARFEGVVRDYLVFARKEEQWHASVCMHLLVCLCERDAACGLLECAWRSLAHLQKNAPFRKSRLVQRGANKVTLSTRNLYCLRCRAGSAPELCDNVF